MVCLVGALIAGAQRAAAAAVMARTAPITAANRAALGRRFFIPLLQRLVVDPEQRGVAA